MKDTSDRGDRQTERPEAVTVQRRPAGGLVPALFVVPPLLLSLLVYGSLTRNCFHDDDFLNLYRIVNLPLAEYLLAPHGGHLLLTRNALFALSYHLFGAWPEPFFAIVLLTHLLNVVLLFHVIRGFTDSPRLACAGAALWGASPVHEGVLAWYSVYGQVLVTTALLVFLIEVQRLARQPEARPRAALWVLLFFAAATSFGLGLAIALVSPAVAWLVLPRGPGRRRSVVLLSLIAGAMPLLFAGLHRTYTVLYAGSDTLGISLAALAAWRHMGGMLWQLVQFGTTVLLMGPVRIAPQLPGWLSPALITLAGTGVLLALLLAPAARRRQLVAMLALSLGCYVLITAGRARLSIGQQLPIAVQLRYHYVATVPLLLACALALDELGSRLPLAVAVRTALLFGWLTLALAQYLWIGPRFEHQEYARREIEQTLGVMRALIAAQPAGSTVTIANRAFFSVGSRWIPPTLFPGWAGVFTIFFGENVVDGRRVVFSETDPKVIAAAARGRRTASLLVAGTPPPRR